LLDWLLSLLPNAAADVAVAHHGAHPSKKAADDRPSPTSRIIGRRQ
jgi:hypothetical protein